ncbi:CHAT domain-containing protein [Parapedobacter sp. 10938]|uniref:CHAT domain-containing protein n=1 Tax=Parapedobacter flavus TaxID=3110225 RepID=UPI002DBA0EBB|nr:CHAT domain-containing tetratricopeptide repeat protein [Parapedobacter sp. 10938]MEC3879208.1 CHAT domain-containing tetratricopeptide repeat protein [Parapedobacter sp. 10938]
MKRPTNVIFKTFQLRLLFLVVFFSCSYSQGQVNKTDSLKTKGDYKIAIAQRISSLLTTAPKARHPHDSLLSELYDEYEAQYLNLGNEGKWTEALPLALACESTFIGELPPKREADLIYNIGYIYDKCDRYLQGIDYFHRSIARYEAINDAEEQDVRNDIALAYNNIGVAHANTGYFTQRKESYLKAKALWESIDDVDKSNLISLYGNLLRLYRQYGDKQAAEELITTINLNVDQWIAEDGFASGNKGMETAKPTSFYQVEKHRLNILYTDLISDKAGGLAHLDSLRTHFRGMNGDDQKRFSAYLLTAISHAAAPLVDYDNLAERKQKKQYLDLGMRESIRLSDRYNQMIFHSQLVSYCLNAEQDKETALSHLDKAIRIGGEMDIREFNLLNLYFKKADVLQQLDRFAEAEKLVLKGISILLNQPITQPDVITIDDFTQRNDIYYVNALKQVASLYKNEYDRANKPDHGRVAQHFYDLAARLFHIYYQKGAYNPWLSMTNAAINEGLLSLHLRTGSAEEMALVNRMENNHSQHLAKEFEAKYLRFLQVPDSLFTQHNLLQVEMAGYEQAAEHPDKEYEALQAEFMDVEAKIQEADAQYFSFFGDTFDIKEVQSELQDREYIVRYVVAEENLYAYTIQKDDIAIVKLGNKDTLLRHAAQYHETIKSKRHDYAEQAKELYNALIDPLRLPLDALQKLVVIPDNKLNFIPFETLVHPEWNRPLVSFFSISYSHGLQLWLLQRKAAPSVRGQQNFAAFAPQYSTDYMSHFADNNPTNRGRLQDIAAATHEAIQLAAYFDGNLYRGDQATKQDFLQRAADYKIYHFAMHALLDESDHRNSSLVFQNGEHLRYHELYGLHFPAELVVLSACNTGMGELENGEGLMSLSRALTYAGVRSSVYSLWEVPDEETADIMLSFYEHLKSGYSKVEALALAKRDFLANNPLKNHPFFWAGFVINGNTDSLSDTTFPNTYLWLIVGGLIVVALLLFMRRRKRAADAVATV